MNKHSIIILKKAYILLYVYVSVDCIPSFYVLCFAIIFSIIYFRMMNMLCFLLNYYHFGELKCSNV